jgi:hypothetical protein
MTSIRKMAFILSRLSDLRSDHRGVAAVEFAIILPFMLAVYIGGVELGDGLAIRVKVTDTAHTCRRSDFAAECEHHSRCFIGNHRALCVSALFGVQPHRFR